MEYHRISFIHDDTEYSFIKAMNAGLTGYDLMKACRVEVTIPLPDEFGHELGRVDDDDLNVVGIHAAARFAAAGDNRGAGIAQLSDMPRQIFIGVIPR